MRITSTKIFQDAQGWLSTGIADIGVFICGLAAITGIAGLCIGGAYALRAFVHFLIY